MNAFFSCHFQKHHIYKGIISDVQIKKIVYINITKRIPFVFGLFL